MQGPSRLGFAGDDLEGEDEDLVGEDEDAIPSAYVDPDTLRARLAQTLQSRGLRRLTASQRHIGDELGVAYTSARTGCIRQLQGAVKEFVLEYWATDADYKAICAMEGILTNRPNPYPGLRVTNADTGEELLEGVDYEMDPMSGPNGELAILIRETMTVQIRIDPSATMELRRLVEHGVIVK